MNVHKGGARIYAIVRTGGKQYRVEPGQRLRVERLDAEPGQQVELPEVLLLSANGEVRLGSPTLPEAKVVAEVLEQRRGPKVIVFKYKPKVRYRRTIGHRQPFTELLVRQIVTPEGVFGLEPPAKAAAPKPRRRRPTAAKAVGPLEATVTAAAAAPAAEEPSGRRSRAVKSKATPEAAGAMEPGSAPPRRPRRPRSASGDE